MDRVQKIMSMNGYCSRRRAEEFIKEGRVKVNNKVIKLGDKAGEDDKITIDDKPLKKKERIYIKFNKPTGYVTSLRDHHERTIMEIIKIKERVFPIGRLDKHTSGLLLLTNDGDFANKIMHPSFEIKKTYLVGLYKDITEAKLRQLEAGVVLEDGKTSPAKTKLHHEKLVEITIHEGKNRIVRRMFKKIGYQIKFLKRIKIGNLDLGKLEEGKIRFMKKSELNKLF